MPEERTKHASLYHAKLAVMEDVDYLQKKKEGAGLNYAFLGEEAIVNAMHDAFIRHGLTVSVAKIEIHKTEVFTNKNGTMQNQTVLLATYRLTHADTKESEDSMSVGEGMDVGDKSANKASTGAYKYFFRQAFMIPSGKDDPDKHDSKDMERQSRGVDQTQPVQQIQQAQKTQQAQKPAKQEEEPLTWDQWAEGVMKDVENSDHARLEKIAAWLPKQNAPVKQHAMIAACLQSRLEKNRGK